MTSGGALYLHSTFSAVEREDGAIEHQDQRLKEGDSPRNHLVIGVISRTMTHDSRRSEEFLVKLQDGRGADLTRHLLASEQKTEI